MTAPDHPLPASGGSFIRQPDGQLLPAAVETAPAEDPKPTVKGGVKAPVKES